MRKSKILGVGMYLPEREVRNQDLEDMKILETSDEWIKQRSGIESRRYVSEGTTGTDIASYAAKQAIENAGISIDQVDFIIYATLSPDFYFPGNGCLLQEKLFGDRPVGALDVRNQCSGFLYSLSIADSFVKCGQYNYILVVGAEVHSRALDFTKRGRNVSVLFGDGAGAAIVGPAEEGHDGIIATYLHSEGKHAKDLWLEYPSNAYKEFITHEIIDEARHYPKMNGQTVFKHACHRMVEVSNKIIHDAGKSVDDLDLVLFHQANLRINQTVASHLHVPDEKVLNTIMWTGNTTAATLPICMCTALEKGKLKNNDLVLLCAFGAGFTWGASLLHW